MYLSRIELNLRLEATQKLLASPQVVHASIEGTRHEGVEKTRSLWRIDTVGMKTYLILLTRERPDFTRFKKQYCADGVEEEVRDYSSFLQTLQNGMKFRFRFVGNPTKCKLIEANNNNIKKKKEALIGVENQLGWFDRKASENGFEPEEVTVQKVIVQKFYRRANEAPVTIQQVAYEGFMEITDIDRFREALVSGIGREKAYGCGMLTLARV